MLIRTLAWSFVVGFFVLDIVYIVPKANQECTTKESTQQHKSFCDFVRGLGFNTVE